MTVFPYTCLDIFVKQLDCPATSDVEFVCTNDDGQVKKLYGSIAMLSHRSDYYKTSKTPSALIFLIAQVFTSQFREGEEIINVDSNTPERRIIKVSEDFDILHNILYYLYTSRIIFDGDPFNSPGYCEKMPKLLEPGVIYSAADRYLLTDLKKKALSFFQTTINVKNITSRVFDQELSLHSEMDTLCTAFFKSRVEDIMATTEYDAFFVELENTSLERRAWVNAKFRDLVEDQLRGLKRKR